MRDEQHIGEPIDLSRLNQRDEAVGDPAVGFDPMRLCVFTTIALISCIAGPFAVLGFAVFAVRGYTRARRGGLLRSRCILGDTRVVLAYLLAIVLLAAVSIPLWVKLWIDVWS